MGNTKILFGLVIILVLSVLCFIFYLPNQEGNKGQEKETGKTVEALPKSLEVSGIVESESEYVEDFIKTEGLSEEAIRQIKEITSFDTKIDASGKHYAKLSVVKDGDEKIVYFSPQNLPRNILVYRVDLETQTFEGLHNEEQNSFKYELLGLQNEALLFAKKNLEDSPGPCYNSWVDAYEHPLSRRESLPEYYSNGGRTIEKLDIEEDSLTPFLVPTEKYVHEVARQEICRYNLEN